MAPVEELLTTSHPASWSKDLPSLKTSLTTGTLIRVIPLLCLLFHVLAIVKENMMQSYKNSASQVDAKSETTVSTGVPWTEKRRAHE